METTTPSPIIKPRSPKVASRLSDFFPGLGQIYCGHFSRGLLFYAVGMLIIAAGIILVALMKGQFFHALLISLVPATALWLFSRFDAHRLAVKAPADYVLKDYNRWYVYAMLAITTIPLALSGAFLIREVAYEAFVVSDNMSPAIQTGQRVLVNKTIYDVEPMRRGDVVIMKGISANAKRTNATQRLVALPGDKVELSGKTIVVNGAPVSRPQTATTTQPATSPASQPSRFVVADGYGFFISDNPDALQRDLGEAPLRNVVGRVEFIYWPRPARVK